MIGRKYQNSHMTTNWTFFLFIPHETNVFGGILESACLCACVSVCTQNTSTFVSFSFQRYHFHFGALAEKENMTGQDFCP